ncbi:hypothetical protein BDV95DRAFT_601905 [Massariosphaeria phaeospora]|uniref:Uncharacterized protein n=1 Tax=Massariosphaeria phaeospora TaxID=100035 RepID=A0A7C8MN54_9PLEO|nr:hypothetical protein BDV95DRAFT_601905 [Massariosphaeria phaeospora]
MLEEDPILEEEIRVGLTALSNLVREMIPSGAKPIPANPDRFNLLARPGYKTCRVCGLPGHECHRVDKAVACRVAMLSLIGFWEDVAAQLAFLYSKSRRFQEAVCANVATYEMRVDGTPLKSGAMEVVVLDRLTRNYLKLVSLYARIRPKALHFMHKADLARYESVTKTLNGFLLDGLTDLFERHVAELEAAAAAAATEALKAHNA